MMLLNHIGKPFINKTHFGLGDNAHILDSRGVVTNPTPSERVWGNALKKEAEKMTLFNKFIGVDILDQFGFPVVHVWEGKGNIIEIQAGGL